MTRKPLALTSRGWGFGPQRLSAPTGVQGEARVAVKAKAYLDRDPDGLCTRAQCLVDRCILAASLRGRTLAGIKPHHRDMELSTCCATARSNSARTSRWAQRSSGVAGSGSPQSRAAAAAMFRLAWANSGGPSSSSQILWFLSRAMAHTRPPSLRRSISRSSWARSCSSSSHASSSH